MTNTEGGTDDEEFRVAAVKDRVDTTVQVWMGLTMGCAKCHSHKYDPITQQEYYRFFALFNQTQDANHGDNSPKAPMPTDEQAKRQTELQERRTTLQAALTKRSPALRWLTEIAATPTEKRKDEQKKRLDEALGKADTVTVTAYRNLEANEKELAALEAQIAQIPILQELPTKNQRVTHVHQRGNFMDPGEVVTPDVPAAFGPLPAGAPHNRLGAAEWIVSRSNALTPRVAVNRFWARLFGVGLVETEEDFGTQGTPPTNPGAARLAGRHLPGRSGLVHEAALQNHRVVSDLPSGFHSDRNSAEGRSAQPMAWARPALPPVRGNGTGSGAGGFRSALLETEGAVGDAAAAGRNLACRV